MASHVPMLMLLIVGGTLSVNTTILLERAYHHIKMAFFDNVCGNSFSNPETSDRSYNNSASSTMEYFSSPVIYPTLWPTLSYHQCGSDSHKEIWITMFDEETTADLFPTNLSTPHSALSVEQNGTSHHMTKDSTLLNNSFQLSKRKFHDCNGTPLINFSSKEPSDRYNISYAQEAVQNSSLKNFIWQSIQTNNCQPIQQSVRRRIDV